MWYRDQCKWCRVYFKPFEEKKPHNGFKFHEGCIPIYDAYMEGIKAQCQLEIRQTLEKVRDT